MFFISHGWISLAKLHSEICERIVEEHGECARPKDAESNDLPDLLSGQLIRDNISGEILGTELREANLQTWSICDEMSQVGIMTSEGKIVRAENSVVAWYDPTSEHGIHVSLSYGTLGSGTGYFSNSGRFEHEEEEVYRGILRARFGAFLYQPIFLQENLVRPLIERLGLVTNTYEGSRKVVEEIIYAFDNGHSVTKAWVKNKFGKGMKTAEFQAIWSEAATLRPDISKPGPRTKKP